MKITIDLDQHKSSEGYYSETIAKAVEKLTGKDFTEVISKAEEEAKPKVPKVDPSKMRNKEKVAFIAEHGREAFEKLFDK